MKVITVFLAIGLWFQASAVHAAYGTSPYEDAAQLKAAIDKRDKRILQILSAYVPSATVMGIEDLKTQYAGNPFITTLLNSVGADSLEPAPSTEPVSPSSTGAALGSPTIVIDAIATLIAKRFQEELAYTFVDEFKETAKQSPAFQTLFPRTSTWLQTVSSQFLVVTMPALRGAFFIDVNNVSRNLESYLDSLTVSVKSKDYRDVLLIALTLLNNAGNADDLARATWDLQSRGSITTNPTDFSKAVRAAAVISRSFKDKNESGWVSTVRLPKDKQLLAFLGLVYKKEKKEISAIFPDASTSAQRLEQLMTDVGPVLEGILNAYKPLANKTIPPSEYMLLVAEAAKLCSAAAKSLHVKPKTSLNFLNDVMITYGAILEKQYSFALIAGVNAVQHVISVDEEKVIRYGSFLTSALAAENADQLAQAMDAAALPVGGYRIKREKAFSISVDSYVGGWFGKETLTSAKDMDNDNDSEAIGFTAPVGLAINWRIDKRPFTLYAPIIDLGAVVSFRLDSPAGTKLPELTWDNVIAPGAFLYVAIWGPISLGGGWQYGPRLREVVNESNTVVTTSASRWCVAATIDVSLFNLYVR